MQASSKLIAPDEGRAAADRGGQGAAAAPADDRKAEHVTKADVGCSDDIEKGKQKGPSSDDDGRQSSERPGTTIKGSWNSLKQQTNQVIRGNETTVNQTEKRKKRSTYALKALFFVILILSAYLVQQYTSALYTIGESVPFLIAVVAFLIIDAAIVIPVLPKWGDGFVCNSWFPLESASCTLIVSCNGYYALAILAVLLLIFVVALLQPKLQGAVKKYVLSPYDTGHTAGEDNQQGVDDDLESQHLETLFELSQGIANSGPLVTAITALFGHYINMAGPVKPTGFFFFCTVALALYLMMVITVRAVGRPHAVCLSIVLIILLITTVITASFSVGGFHGSGSTPQAVKNSTHRKMRVML